MKRTILFLVVAVIAAGGFFACDLFEQEDLGTLTITLPGNELPSSSARAALPPEILNTLRFQIDCTKGKKTISNIYSAGKTVNISLATGTWDITLKVLDEDNYIIGGDTETVSIKPGKTTPVNFKITVVMMKEGASLDGTLSATATADTITIIQPYLTLATPTGQAIEYARGSDDSSPSTAWQDSLIFSGLNPNTTYYIFARSKANSTHKAGTPVVSNAITTLATGTTNIVYYWVNNDVLESNADDDPIIIDKNEELTITAQEGEDYEVLQWEVNGVKQDGEIETTFTFKRSATGEYTIGLFIVKDLKLYNTNIYVTVFCFECNQEPCECTGARAFTSIADIQRYLDENPEATEAKPLELKVKLELEDMSEGGCPVWLQLCAVLNEWTDKGNYANLDLSLCDMEGTEFNATGFTDHGEYTVGNAGSADFTYEPKYRILTLTLPEAATSITGTKSFGGFTIGAFNGFREVIGNEVTTIGDQVFKGYLELSSGRQDVANSALINVSFPKAETIDWGAFSYCTSLESVEFSNVTAIEGKEIYEGIFYEGAFYNCISLTSAEFPEVETIGVYAFYGCNDLTSINISKITSIGKEAFHGCSSLVSLNIPNITSIGNEAFRNCTSISELWLPKNEIAFGGNQAFYGWTDQQIVYIPFDTLSESGAFYTPIPWFSTSIPFSVFIIKSYDGVQLRP